MTLVNYERFMNTFFDIFAALISISDIATDVIVTYQFYQNDRMVFFGVSLSFIILAQLSYTLAFVALIGNESKPYKIFLMWLFILPFSPIISFIFYLTEDPNSYISNLFKDYFPFAVEFTATYIDNGESKLKQWMKKKIHKHLGFIMESLIEAFPQSILQLAAIVIYKEADIVRIISILISMLSVSSKSFILSIQFSMNIKTLFFNWLCAVTDFIGIFFAVSWAFYDSDYGTISMIASIWKMKVLFTVIPLVFSISVGVYCFGIYKLWISIYPQCDIAAVFAGFCGFVTIQLLWAFGMVLGVLALEISTFLLIAFPMFVIGSIRLPTDAKSNQLWLNVLSWIKSAHSHKYDGILSLTKTQDSIIRICCINQSMIDNKKLYTRFDKKFVAFINSHTSTNYMGIKSLSELRSHHDVVDFGAGPSPEFLPSCLALLSLPYLITKQEIDNGQLIGREWMFYGVCFVNFIIAPFYYLSRIINIAFPFATLMLLYVNGISIFEDVDAFQTVTLLMYISFIVILGILAIPVMVEQYYLWHIMPSKDIGAASISLETVQYRYNGIVIVPVRDSMLNKKYGLDIAKIIIEYCNAITSTIELL